MALSRPIGDLIYSFTLLDHVVYPPVEYLDIIRDLVDIF